MWRHSGFFALRTPRLAIEELRRFGDGLEAPAAVGDAALEGAIAIDRTRLHARLRAWVARAEVREALFVASPDLDAAIDRWLVEPEGRRGRKIEAALVRYLARMSARATPVGLVAGWSLGTIAATTRLRVEGCDQYRRRTRFPVEALRRLAAVLARDPAVRDALTYRPNPTAHRAA